MKSLKEAENDVLADTLDGKRQKKNKLCKCYDVAFNNNVQVILDKSFNEEIDVRFGEYIDGSLTIGLAPSRQKIDWKINLDFLRRRVKPFYASMTSKVKVHRGYLKEWYRWRDEFFEIINSDPKLLKALEKGLIISGRSKGGGEAPIIAIDIVRNFDCGEVLVGMLEAPLVGNKAFADSVERYISKENMFHVRYGADIVTMIPPTFKNPGKFIWFNKKKFISFLDHATGCFDQEKMYEYAEGMEQ